MIAACKETEVIAMFRANKSAAIPLIRQGAHGKPMWAKFSTSPKTGVLTASTEAHKNLAYENGAFVIHPDTISSRTAIRFTKGPNGKLIKETTKLEGDWTIEPWQVVGKDGKPFVGDYDLLGVAPIRSPGSNVSGVPKEMAYGDWTGPWVEKYRAAINRKLDKPRVLHGPLDAYGGPPSFVASKRRLLMPFTQMAALSFWMARKLKKTSSSPSVVKRSQNSHRLSEIPISNFMRSTSEMLIRNGGPRRVPSSSPRTQYSRWA